MHSYSLWKDLSCSQQACYRFLKIIISVGVLIWVVNLTLQSNRKKMSHWPRAQIITQELSLDLPGETDNKESLTDFASLWCLLFISLQQCLEKSQVNEIHTIENRIHAVSDTLHSCTEEQASMETGSLLEARAPKSRDHWACREITVSTDNAT